MSQPKEIYVKGTTATSVDNYMYLSQTREMIGWDKYHNNDVMEELDKDLEKELERAEYWEHKATELAEAVGKHLGIDFGEHSSANNPVLNAIEELQ